MPFVNHTADGNGLYCADIPATNYSIFVRINVLGVFNNEAAILIMEASPSTDRIWIYKLNPTAVSLWDSTSNVDETTSGLQLTTGRHSWGLTVAGGSPGVSKSYYDGSLLETNDAPAANLLTLGNTPQAMDGGVGLSAEFSELRIWSATLSGADMAAEALATSPARSANLYSSYPLGADLKDASGNGRADCVQVGTADALGGTITRGAGNRVQATL